MNQYRATAHLELDGIERPIRCAWAGGTLLVPLDQLPPRIVCEGTLTLSIWSGRDVVDRRVQPVRFLAA